MSSDEQLAKYREVVDVLLEHINWTQCKEKHLTPWDIHDAIVMLETELREKFELIIGYSITGKVKLEKEIENEGEK